MNDKKDDKKDEVKEKDELPIEFIEFDGQEIKPRLTFIEIEKLENSLRKSGVTIGPVNYAIFALGRVAGSPTDALLVIYHSISHAIGMKYETFLAKVFELNWGHMEIARALACAINGCLYLQNLKEGKKKIEKLAAEAKPKKKKANGQ